MPTFTTIFDNKCVLNHESRNIKTLELPHFNVSFQKTIIKPTET